MFTRCTLVCRFIWHLAHSLGALTAQFASQLRIDLPELDLNIENGKFDDLVSWLKTNIHEKLVFLVQMKL